MAKVRFSFSSLSSLVVAVIEIRSHRSISLKISKHHQLTRIALCCRLCFSFSFPTLSLFSFFYTLFTAWAMKILNRKMLKKKSTRYNDLLGDVQREVELHRALSMEGHPHIVHLHEVIDDEKSVRRR